MFSSSLSFFDLQATPITDMLISIVWHIERIIKRFVEKSSKNLYTGVDENIFEKTF